jgi:small subunit ribosomal protein S6
MTAATINVALYEGLFLMNQSTVASDFTGAMDHLKQIFDRAEAEVIVLDKWDERKLAYEIEGQKRGTFFLAIFRARGTQIANIERDCNLSELVLRNIIIRGDHLGEPELELAKKGVKAMIEAKLRQKPIGEDEVPEDAIPSALDDIEEEIER